MSYIPEDRQVYGLVLDFSLSDNLALKKYYREPFSKKGIIKHQEFDKYGQRLIENYDKTIKYDNKAYRVFASKDNNDGKLLKCDGVRNPAKFGNTPDHCFVENGDVRNMDIPHKLDKQYYIDLAKKRLEDFGYDKY